MHLIHPHMAHHILLLVEKMVGAGGVIVAVMVMMVDVMGAMDVMGTKSMKTKLFFLLGGVLIAILAIYLTPLKHKNIIQPAIDDIDPSSFYTDFVENPEDYIFIDVRSESEYEDFHAQGSLNMPLHTLFDQRLNLPKSGKTIVLICTGGRASGVAYSYLEHFGFLNLKRIEGGVNAWHAADLPITGIFSRF